MRDREREIKLGRKRKRVKEGIIEWERRVERKGKKEQLEMLRWKQFKAE